MGKFTYIIIFLIGLNSNAQISKFGVSCGNDTAFCIGLNSNMHFNYLGTKVKLSNPSINPTFPSSQPQLY